MARKKKTSTRRKTSRRENPRYFGKRGAVRDIKGK